MNGKWKINNQKFRMMVQKTQNMLDKTDIRPMGGHLMFQHVYRDWNQEADHLTHVAREKGRFGTPTSLKEKLGLRL